ncbi:hypothetical protein BGZ46_005622 [Entomortierella lignicola]|nr:hypothetical protein BGZ46_005622 [Entomortierella lignicola]
MGENQSTVTEHSMAEHVQPKIGSIPNLSTTISNGTDMEGVEVEVSRLAIHDHIGQEQGHISNHNDADESMGEDDSGVPGLCDDDGSSSESDDDNNGNDDEDTQAQESHDFEEITNEDVAAAETEEQDQGQSSQPQSAATSSFPTEPSIILVPDAVYSAVPVSSELHIIPHASKGFNWNEDLFLKPHQRRSLGVDEMYNADGSSTEGDNHDTAIPVHEIHMDDEESQQILPS